MKVVTGKGLLLLYMWSVWLNDDSCSSLKLVKLKKYTIRLYVRFINYADNVVPQYIFTEELLSYEFCHNYLMISF